VIVPFRKLSTKKGTILTSKIDQLIITIGINTLFIFFMLKSKTQLAIIENWVFSYAYIDIYCYVIIIIIR